MPKLSHGFTAPTLQSLPLATRLRTSILPPLITFLLVILIWQTLKSHANLPPYLLPSPLEVGQALYTNAPLLFSAAALTAAGAAAGFLLSLVSGVLIAILFSQSKWIEQGLYPYAVFLQTVPIVAIAPLIILWLGTGFQSVVVIAFIISVFPIITNGTIGLTSVNRSLVDLFRVYNASRWMLLWKLRLPHAIPNIVTGAQIASGLSVIGAIVGESFAGFGARAHGLGYVIILSSGQLKTALLFAAVFTSTLLGWIIFRTVAWSGDKLVARWQDV